MLRSQQTCFPPCATNKALSPRLMQMFGSNAKCVPNELWRRLYHTTPHCTSRPRRLPKSTNSLFAKPPTPLNRNRPGSSLRLLGGVQGEPALCKSSGAAFLTSAVETYHLVHGHEVGIQGDDSEENLEGGGGKHKLICQKILQHQWHDELFTGRSVKR